jgi:hypothetical protein
VRWCTACPVDWECARVWLREFVLMCENVCAHVIVCVCEDGGCQQPTLCNTDRFDAPASATMHRRMRSTLSSSLAYARLVADHDAHFPSEGGSHCEVLVFEQ